MPVISLDTIDENACPARRYYGSLQHRALYRAMIFKHTARQINPVISEAMCNLLNLIYWEENITRGSTTPRSPCTMYAHMEKRY